MTKENLPTLVEKRILLIRGHKVMLDTDLAQLYEVETRILTRAVKRNLDRFPEDFMFQLKDQEVTDLRSQFGISSSTHGGRRYNPYVFTEQGIAMLSSVLRSKRAVQVNIEIMRAFVRLRRLIAEHHELKMQLENLELKYDKQFKVVFDAIRNIMEEKTMSKRQIGFGRNEKT